jgi:hypothetical protein
MASKTNRSLKNKAERAARQARGVWAIAPRFSEKAGRFTAVESSKACYLNPGVTTPAYDAAMVTRYENDARRPEPIGKTRRQFTAATYGNFVRREPLAAALHRESIAEYRGTWEIVRR